MSGRRGLVTVEVGDRRELWLGHLVGVVERVTDEHHPRIGAGDHEPDVTRRMPWEGHHLDRIGQRAGFGQSDPAVAFDWIKRLHDPVGRLASVVRRPFARVHAVRGVSKGRQLGVGVVGPPDVVLVQVREHDFAYVIRGHAAAHELPRKSADDLEDVGCDRPLTADTGVDEYRQRRRLHQEEIDRQPPVPVGAHGLRIALFDGRPAGGRLAREACFDRAAVICDRVRQRRDRDSAAELDRRKQRWC